MAITIESGRLSGEAIAKWNLSKYAAAETKFRRYVTEYRSDAPYALVLAHLITANPALAQSPPVWRSRKGFLYAGLEAARYAGLDFGRANKPEVCAYLWSLELNRNAQLLYTKNPKLFPTASIDLWKCAYLQYRLGTSLWASLWLAAAPRASAGDVYPQLVYVVNNLTRSLAGWPVEKLKREVLVTLEQVFYTWRVKGTSVIDGSGRIPVTYGKESFNTLFFGG